MHAAIASRFRADRTASSFARVHEAGDVWAAVACNAYEFSFSAGWGQAGAELCNDAFARGWAAGGQPRERFDRAATEMLSAFRGAARRLWTDGDRDDDAASASVIAVLRDGDGLHACWLGEYVALLVRDRVVIAASAPHTLARELARHGIDPVGHPQAGIVLKSVTVDPVHELERADWECRSGDHLIVGSGAVASSLHPAELAALVGPDDTATRIADATVARTDPFGVIAIAIRI